MSKLVLQTNTLKDLVNRAVKVCQGTECGLNGLMELSVESNVFYIKTTNNSYFLTLNIRNVECESFHAVVSAKFFAQLISKITTQSVCLSVEENKLVVEGNGTYNLELRFGSGDSVIKFPTQEFNSDVETIHLDSLQLKNILSLNKSCKSKGRESGQYYDYYMDDQRVLTMSDDRACLNKVKVFNTSVLVTPELFDLVPLVSDLNGVNIQSNIKNIDGVNQVIMLFTSEWGSLYGVSDTQFGVEEFMADRIVEAMSDKLPHEATINRTLLLNALDRICLFTQIFGNNVVEINLNNEGIILKSHISNSVESIKFIQPIANVEPITAKIDGESLKEVINSCTKEDLTLNFGNDKDLYINCDNVTQVVTFYAENEEVEIG